MQVNPTSDEFKNGKVIKSVSANGVKTLGAIFAELFTGITEPLYKLLIIEISNDELAYSYTNQGRTFACMDSSGTNYANMVVKSIVPSGRYFEGNNTLALNEYSTAVPSGNRHWDLVKIMD